MDHSDPGAVLLQRLRDINVSAAFNRFAGIEVSQCSAGIVTLSMRWREELGQYAGFLHAGVIAALIDTACGFAAFSSSGQRALAAHFSVNCLRPASGDSFRVTAKVVKPGRTLVFTSAELYAITGADEKLVATGDTILSLLPSETATRV